MLKFSKANAKTQALKQVPELQKFLGKRGRKTAKVYSLDLLSGYSCPYAEKCLSRAVVMPNGKVIAAERIISCHPQKVKAASLGKNSLQWQVCCTA